MARYGDLDALAVKWMLASPEQKKIFRQIIDKHPTADVVPKSEVEQLKRNLEQCENGYRQQMHLLQCKLADAESEVKALKDNIKFLQDRRFQELSEVRQEVAREIFEEIDELDIQLNNGDLDIKYFSSAVAELKKQYTESEGKE